MSEVLRSQSNARTPTNVSIYDLPTQDKLPVLQALLRDEGQSGLALDVGSGTGYTTFAAFGNRPTVCVDLHEPNLRQIRAWAAMEGLTNRPLCVIARATALPFKPGSFQFILCSEVLEHLEDDETAVGEMGRVLAAGGKIVVSVPYTGFRWTSFLELLHVKTVHGYPGPEYHVRSGYDERSLGSLFNRHELEVERYAYYLRFFTRFTTDLVSLAHLVYQRLVHRRRAWNWSDVSAVAQGTAFRLYAFVFPLVWAFSRLDGLLTRYRGFGLIAMATHASPQPHSQTPSGKESALPKLE